jgi:formylglycine-generating enzyme required for sulfatase activity
MHNDYFWHKAYGDYPVVGVKWTQAKLLCLENTKNSYIKSKKKGHDLINSFRLPTEAEWEYSARGGLESATILGWTIYENDRGCFLANFKPNREIMQQIRHFTQLKQSHMSQMVIIYITWQGMFQNGQILTTLMLMNMFPQ